MADEPPLTLAGVGRATFDLFKEVIELSVNIPAESDIRLDRLDTPFVAERDRFKIWAIDLGLLVPGHGSLDYRVREAQSLSRTIRTFLVDLNQSLVEVLERLKDPNGHQQSHLPIDFDRVGHPAGSPDHGGRECYGEAEGDEGECDLGSEPELDLLLDVIKDVVDRLYKLSTKVRNPSTRLVSTKAQGFQQIDHETGIDLVAVFEHYDYGHVNSVLSQYRSADRKDTHTRQEPGTEPRINKSESGMWHDTTICALCAARMEWAEDEETLGRNQTKGRPQYSDCHENRYFLVHRIARANNKRRQQFAYWRNHRDKLTSYTLFASGESLAARQQDNLRTMLMGEAGGSAPSVTTASRIQPTLLNFDDERSAISISEYAPSASAGTGLNGFEERVEFPVPPKVEINQKFLNCPYCFTTCPSDVFFNRAWK